MKLAPASHTNKSLKPHVFINSLGKQTGGETEASSYIGWGGLRWPLHGELP